MDMRIKDEELSDTEKQTACLSGQAVVCIWVRQSKQKKIWTKEGDRTE